MVGLKRVLVLTLAACALSACSLPYYVQAIHGQLHLLRLRTPIGEVLKDPQTSAKLKAELMRVEQIRKFAVDVLHLPDNASYTTYVDLKRPYVVWNVVAAKEFSIQPIHWCFPFAGCVSYRGFFHRDAAERFRAKLDARGYDTYSGGTTAYSTLGYFADPVLNTMLEGGDEYVAGVLFHELAHQKLYVKGDSEFDEAFAMAVEQYGVVRWLERQHAPARLAAYRRRLKRQADFADLVAEQQRRLAEIYAGPKNAAQKSAAKAAAFARMRAEYERMKRQRWGGAKDYDAWFAQDLNNASLAAVATYRRWLPALRAQLAELGLTGFYTEMGQLAALPQNARDRQLKLWLAEGSTAGRLPQRR
jgi:predicted aminopeptidase